LSSLCNGSGSERGDGEGGEGKQTGDAEGHGEPFRGL
jgi:hypothetical protein